MNAKLTDPQWFNRGDGSGSGTLGFHPHPNAQEAGANNDNDDDDLDSILLPDLHGKSDILEEKHIRELSKLMPARAEGYSWTLAFSTTTMGFSLKSLYRALSRYEGPVLLVIKDSEHNVFGAFSSCNLKPSESFYGTGETYLFTFKQPTSASEASAAPPATSAMHSGSAGGDANAATAASATTTIKSINNNQTTNNSNNNSGSTSGSINNNNSPVALKHANFKRFPWTGDNLYFIKGDLDSLTFGAGEGSFGLWLDEDLYHGSTHTCKTYNNQPLANHEDFVVCTLECWCFL